MAITCPCFGFGHGEGGDLVLIRSRRGVEIDRLPITPLFVENFPAKGRIAIIQRWELNETDLDSPVPLGFAAAVAKRPTVQVMHLADYEQDGQETGFYLQTGPSFCNRSSGVVIGVSKRNPRLHAIGTASNPSAPLYLEPQNWEALRRSSGPIEVLDWGCSFVGVPEKTLQLRWTPIGVDGTRREYSCDPGSRILLKEDPL
jgi:hypothetical protein